MITITIKGRPKPEPVETAPIVGEAVPEVFVPVPAKSKAKRGK